jgi:hypothetical protein
VQIVFSSFRSVHFVGLSFQIHLLVRALTVCAVVNEGRSFEVVSTVVDTYPVFNLLGHTCHMPGLIHIAGACSDCVADANLAVVTHSSISIARNSRSVQDNLPEVSCGLADAVWVGFKAYSAPSVVSVQNFATVASHEHSRELRCVFLIRSSVVITEPQLA